MSDFLDVLWFWKFHREGETPTPTKPVFNKQENRWTAAS